MVCVRDASPTLIFFLPFERYVLSSFSIPKKRQREEKIKMLFNPSKTIKINETLYKTQRR